MNSSTSSSEPAAPVSGPAPSAPRWAAFARAFLATAVFATLGLLALAFLLDPYGTGRSPLPLKDGVRPQGPRTAAASRGRDQSFQAGIFGNSHVQLLSPEELKQRTGVPFVSLIAPATRPREILTLIDWFLRHHPTPPRAIVVGIDHFWCTPNPALPNDKPFPFWLFSRSLPDYVVGLLRFDVLEEFQRRIAFLLSARPERARPDGYWDYEEGYRLQGYAQDPALRAKLLKRLETGGDNIAGPFPAAAALEALMATAPVETALILLRPPAYETALPLPNTPDAAADAACRTIFADLAARRPRTTLIDWRADRPELHDAEQFFDHTHYRQGIARLVEADIAAALARLR
jgi:hypothetical protein